MTTDPYGHAFSDDANTDFLLEHFPLHYLVWHNQGLQLRHEINNNFPAAEQYLEDRDSHGRTPLQLAVKLYRDERQIRLLLQYCSPQCFDNCGFNIFHDAITTKDLSLLKLLYEKVERAEIERKRDNVKNTIVNQEFISIKDFYYEIHMDYSSNLFQESMPSDIVRIWKRGNRIRIDSTLVEVDTTSGTGLTFLRNARTWIYKVTGDDIHECDQRDFVCFCLEQNTRMYGLDKLYNADQVINADADGKDGTICMRRTAIPRASPNDRINWQLLLYSATNYRDVLIKKSDHLTYSDQVLSQWNQNLQAGITDIEYFDPASQVNIGPPSTMKKIDFVGKAKLWMTTITHEVEGLHFTTSQHVVPILGLLLHRFSFLEPLYCMLNIKEWVKNSQVPIKVEIPLHIKLRGPAQKVTIRFANLYGLDGFANLGFSPEPYWDDERNCERILIEGIKIEPDVFQIPRNYRRFD